MRKRHLHQMGKQLIAYTLLITMLLNGMVTVNAATGETEAGSTAAATEAAAAEDETTEKSSQHSSLKEEKTREAEYERTKVSSEADSDGTVSMPQLSGTPRKAGRQNAPIRAPSAGTSTGTDYRTGYGDITYFELSRDDNDYTQKTNSTISLTSRIVNQIREQDDYTGFENTLINYEFRIPEKTASGGTLTFQNYAWLSNATLGSQLIDGVRYRVLRGQRNYKDAMPGAVEETVMVFVSGGNKGDSYDIQESVWLNAEGESSKKITSKTITLDSTLDEMVNLYTTGYLAFSGYYDKATGQYYQTAAEAAAAGVPNVKWGRFYWVTSGVNHVLANTTGIEQFAKDTDQSWDLKYSVTKTSTVGRVTTTETETDPEYMPVLVDAVDNKRINRADTTGYVRTPGIDISMGGNYAVPYDHAGSGQVPAEFRGTDSGTMMHVVARLEKSALNSFYTTALVFVPEDPTVSTGTTRRLVWEVDNLDITGVGGSKGTEHTLDDNQRSLVFQPRGGSGNVGKGINIIYQSTPAAVAGVGETFYVHGNVGYAETIQDAEINAVNLFFKWDTKGVEPEWSRTKLEVGATKDNFSGADKQIKVLYAAKADGSHWNDNDEMLQAKTSDSNMIFYDSYESLIADGKICVGVLHEYRGGIVTGTRLGMNGNERFKAIGEGGKDYVICIDYEHWSGSNVLTTADTYSGTNGGTKPSYAKPDYTLYADLGNQTGYTVDDWSSGTGIVQDVRHNRDATSLHQVSYVLLQNTYDDTGKGYAATVLNGMDGPKTSGRNRPAVTFNVSEDQRTVAVKSRFEISWRGNIDPKDTIHMEFQPEGEKGTTAIEAGSTVWDYIHAAGKVYVADEDAVVTWDEETKTFSSDDPSFREIHDVNGDGRYEFSVEGGGAYHVYHTYALGDEYDLSKDVKSDLYNLGTSFYVKSQDICFYSVVTYNCTRPTVTVIRNGVMSLLKSALDRVVAPGEEMGYTLTSSSENSSYAGTAMLDVLPFNGDGRGSEINGTYKLNDGNLSLILTTSNTTVESDLKLYYTTDERVRTAGSGGAVPTANEVGSFDPDSSLGVTWKEFRTTKESGSTAQREAYTMSLQAGDTIPTAIIMKGNFAKGERYAIRMTFETEGNHYSNIYANNASMSAPAFGNTNIFSTTSMVEIVSKIISGTAWIDENKDGVRNEDESLLSDVRVRLYHADGTEVTQDVYGNPYGEVRTDTNGQYRFKDMPDHNDGWYVEYELTKEQAKNYDLTIYHAPAATDTTDSDFQKIEGSTTRGKTERFTLPTYAEQSGTNTPVRASAVRDMGFVNRPIVIPDTGYVGDSRFWGGGLMICLFGMLLLLIGRKRLI